MATHDAHNSSVMARLAWRAKWRNRFTKWKTVIFLAVIFVIAVPTTFAFVPAGPKAVFDYIERENPQDKPIQPWATEWMYKLGFFYSITMREDDAIRCYEKLEEWYNLERNPMEIPRGDYFIGCAVFRHAEVMDLSKQRKQIGFEIYQFYLEEFSTLKNPQLQSEPDFDNRAQLAIQRYRGEI